MGSLSIQSLGMAPTLHGRAAWLGAAGCTRQKSGFDPKTINDVIRMGGLPLSSMDSCPHYALHGCREGCWRTSEACPQNFTYLSFE